jgi:hypothetical protein
MYQLTEKYGKYEHIGSAKKVESLGEDLLFGRILIDLIIKNAMIRV